MLGYLVLHTHKDISWDLNHGEKYPGLPAPDCKIVDITSRHIVGQGDGEILIDVWPTDFKSFLTGGATNTGL